MNSVRERIETQFSNKVYPNPVDPKIARQFVAGIERFRKEYIFHHYFWILGDNSEFSGSWYETRDPNSTETIVGRFPQFSASRLASIAEFRLPHIRAAGRRFFLENPWQKRVRLLEIISDVVKERFWLLCAAKMYETGQSASEAIGETDEEIDFPLVNAMYLEELNRELRFPSPSWAGDLNGERFVPHGVFLDVEPFNFPGAIPMDMATKALAMGNAVILKPSPKASLCGYLVWESIKIAFERVGINWHGVVNYAPGDAEVVDAFLSSPEIAGMSFTGSSAVFHDIKERHGQILRHGWRGKAKLVTGSAETSGVNTFIVCADTDPVYAANEYVKSFVGRSGQKCSSARIAFVDMKLYSLFMAAVVERLEQIHYGDVRKGADLGAMITAADSKKLSRQIEELKNAGLVRVYREKPITRVSNNDFPPTVLEYTDSAYNERAVRTLMNTEFFGPVSTVVPFRNLDKVERMCNVTNFALTGSVFCRDIGTLERVLNFIPAGNLYWNRKCTGALVEMECFGGLRSASSPNGVKGKHALTLFGSDVTFSGFYPEKVDNEYKEAAREMFTRNGFNLSKW
ncbi:hypothetical protein A3A20_01840 [Candidatus Wolfebacteria bacterium RIFCSPLOWO2_01_FULL_45_19]|uniref:Aldehyde dehydrogenase domain-containing protein n=1 Tax=Candidatus Wolfebacteria bacterium RIFCSPLOWO2_01_FULL_45_19 TaxID=1802557 RepID=A0A1F8DUJ8_9BACT|nr:MAG: Delta-1-pyrroline-5-carboxylate dehydrogenase [Parcubacteria group bacterium GW2011_GWB1_45_9]OGM91659.1 MAG: hypothetical protein A3A20_01840 [Candidatus Wolfebacteria bacterium RIFCSPLOWO2_01_FULL_45_19]